jgi:hypothetical protein
MTSGRPGGGRVRQLAGRRRRRWLPTLARGRRSLGSEWATRPSGCRTSAMERRRLWVGWLGRLGYKLKRIGKKFKFLGCYFGGIQKDFE